MKALQLRRLMQAAAGSLFVNLTDLQGARAAQAGNSRAIAIDPRGSRVNVPLEERTGAASRVGLLETCLLTACAASMRQLPARFRGKRL